MRDEKGEKDKMKKMMTVLFVGLAVSAVAHPTVEFTIVPRTRYRLSYTWEATGCTDRAAEPLGAWGLFGNRYYRGPMQELEFFGPEGKDRKGPRFRRFQPLLPGTSGRWVHEFHAPEGQVKMTLTVADNRKTGLAVNLSDIRLEEVKDAPTVNVNPDFALGLYNYSGLRGGNGEGFVMLKNPQGGNSFYGGMSFDTEPMPIEAGAKYRLEYAGWGLFKSRIDPFMNFSGKGKFPTVDLPRVYRDEKNPEAPGRRVYEFTAPEGAEWVSFCFYHGTLDSLRLTRL